MELKLRSNIIQPNWSLELELNAVKMKRQPNRNLINWKWNSKIRIQELNYLKALNKGKFEMRLIANNGLFEIWFGFKTKGGLKF